MRTTAAAGGFYPGDALALKRSIKKAYTHRLGPGSVPEPANKRSGRIKGLVVPHAGYPFSGQIAAHAFAALARDGMPDTVVIIGPNHTGRGSGVALTMEDHNTPLGPVAVDLRLAKLLFSGIIDNSDVAHRREHSIEVQLPFLKLLKPDIGFVPIDMYMQDQTTARRLGEQLGKTLAEYDGDVVVIASTDLTHYEPASVAHTKDALAIERIEQLDIPGLYETVASHSISMCGVGPAAATIEAVRSLGATKGRLLKYGTSGDVHDMSEVVGYAAIEIL